MRGKRQRKPIADMMQITMTIPTDHAGAYEWAAPVTT